MRGKGHREMERGAGEGREDGGNDMVLRGRFCGGYDLFPSDVLSTDSAIIFYRWPLCNHGLIGVRRLGAVDQAWKRYIDLDGSDALAKAQAHVAFWDVMAVAARMYAVGTATPSGLKVFSLEMTSEERAAAERAAERAAAERAAERAAAEREAERAAAAAERAAVRAAAAAEREAERAAAERAAVWAAEERAAAEREAEREAEERAAVWAAAEREAERAAATNVMNNLPHGPTAAVLARHAEFIAGRITLAEFIDSVEVDVSPLLGITSPIPHASRAAPHAPSQHFSPASDPFMVGPLIVSGHLRSLSHDELQELSAAPALGDVASSSAGPMSMAALASPAVEGFFSSSVPSVLAAMEPLRDTAVAVAKNVTSKILPLVCSSVHSPQIGTLASAMRTPHLESTFVALFHEALLAKGGADLCGPIPYRGSIADQFAACAATMAEKRTEVDTVINTALTLEAEMELALTKELEEKHTQLAAKKATSHARTAAIMTLEREISTREADLAQLRVDMAEAGTSSVPPALFRWEDAYSSSHDMAGSQVRRTTSETGQSVLEFAVVHELPIFRGSRVDLAFGMRSDQATLVFGHFEPGRGDKSGQSYAYATMEALALAFLPVGPSLLGLYGDFPSPSKPGSLTLTGYLVHNDSMDNGSAVAVAVAESLACAYPGEYVEMAVAFAFAMKAVTAEMVRRIVEPGTGPKRIGKCVSVEDGRDDRFVAKWYLGSASRQPNLWMWDMFSPGVVVRALAVAKPFRPGGRTIDAAVGDVAMVFFRFVADVERGGRPGAKVSHFVSLGTTLAAMAERGVVHGDVRRWNVVFAPDGNAVLIDYDLARVVGAGDAVYPNPFNVTALDDGARHGDVQPGGPMAVAHDAFAFGSIMKDYAVLGEGSAQEVWKAVWDGLLHGGTVADAVGALEGLDSQLDLRYQARSAPVPNAENGDI